MVVASIGTPAVQRTLRDATHHLHQRVERELGLVSANLTRRDYVATLQGLLIAYAALEDELERHAASLAPLGLDWQAHRKAPLLRADLAALDVPLADASAIALPIPELHTLAAALGCMYVMEGATLGGAVIRRHVGKALQIGPRSGAAFFACYGDAVGARWQAFRAALELALADPLALAQAADRAVATFALVEACLIQTRRA
jgi:heme oxygenase (biliverdin-IX-beta and delta-forming)